MFNYSKANFEINSTIFGSIENFEAIARLQASESLDHTAKKKGLEEKIAALVKEDKPAKAEQEELDNLERDWKARTAEFNLKLYGGKVDGKKTEGVCSLVTDNLYKAYVASVAEGKTAAYKSAIKDFVTNLVTEETVKDSAVNHFITDIFTIMSSTKYNSNKNLAEGCAFITTVNKRTYKKMFLGAICDVVNNNRTLKVAKPKKDGGKKTTSGKKTTK